MANATAGWQRAHTICCSYYQRIPLKPNQGPVCNLKFIVLIPSGETEGKHKWQSGSMLRGYDQAQPGGMLVFWRITQVGVDYMIRSLEKLFVSLSRLGTIRNHEVCNGSLEIYTDVSKLLGKVWCGIFFRGSNTRLSYFRYTAEQRAFDCLYSTEHRIVLMKKFSHCGNRRIHPELLDSAWPVWIGIRHIFYCV